MTSAQEYNGKVHHWFEQKEHLKKDSFPEPKGDIETVLYAKLKADFKQDSISFKAFQAIVPSIGVKSYLSRKFINIPFTDVVFDVNDLGIFSGVFFCLIMLILWYNLGLKYANLFIAFAIIKDIEGSGKKKTYYNLLSMSQIISIPDNTPKSSVPSLLVYVPYLLFLLPAVIYAIIFVNDFYTTIKVSGMNELLTRSSSMLEAMMLLIILILATGCINLDKKTDKLWDDWKEVFTELDGRKELNV